MARSTGLLTLFIALAACGPAQPPVADDAATAASTDSLGKALLTNYLAAINSNNVDSLMAIMTDDVVFMVAGSPPIVGKAAVRNWVQGYVDAYQSHWEKQAQEFTRVGDWAFERYNSQNTDTPRAGGDPVEGTGWGLVIYHRGADGRWRVARDAFGSDK